MHCILITLSYVELQRKQKKKRNESREVFIKRRSQPASLSFKGQSTDETTVKWSIDPSIF